MITKTDQWKTEHPDAYIGILVVKNVLNLPKQTDLDLAQKDLENELRVRYELMDRKAIREDSVYRAYDAFYRLFKKTYHVQLQLESIVFKGKNIFSPSTLVASMFMAELKTGLLTAAHDLSAVQLPLSGNISSGNEIYQRLDGSQQQLKAGDLFIQDQQGILSSVIYGPDQRTQIKSETNQALYTTYGPPGIDKHQIQVQLEILESYIKLFSPQVDREILQVI
jgi:DNA/RNA-binding domain of Phe-tRNA-synthetase-like protein